MKRLAGIIAALLFAVAVYRAWTQSITYDEALTWRFYIVTPLSSMLQSYDANHHILHSWLVRLITSIFGVSTFTMRIVALGGAALYLWTLVRLGSRLFGRTWLVPATVVLLGGAPLVMDFQVAARGYGLAMAFFLLGLERLVSALLGEARRKDLWIGGSALGLSIAANLVFAVPILAASALFIWLWRPPLPKGEKPKKRNLQSGPQTAKLNDFLLPFAAVMLLLFLVAPVKHMLKPGLFYVGVATLGVSLHDLAINIVAHNDGIGRLNRVVTEHVAVKQTFGWVVYPGVLLFGLVWGWRQLRVKSPSNACSLSFFFACTAVASWIMLVLLNLATGLPYPVDRTGIYQIPLFLLVILCLATSEAKRVRVGGIALSAVLAVSFAIQFQTTHFRVWRYDADTRELVEEINAEGQRQGRVMTTGISWLLEPTAIFYQTTENLRSFEYAAHKEMRPGLDYYLFTTEERHLIPKYNLREIKTAPTAQILMLEPAEASN